MAWSSRRMLPTPPVRCLRHHLGPSTKTEATVVQFKVQKRGLSMHSSWGGSLGSLHVVKGRSGKGMQVAGTRSRYTLLPLWLSQTAHEPHHPTGPASPRALNPALPGRIDSCDQRVVRLIPLPSALPPPFDTGPPSQR
jgi:hypothetical protein